MILKPKLGRKPSPGHSLSKGLVGMWLFNDSPQALGTTYDLSGNGNHGTLVNQTHSSAGKFGSALEFDGSGDEVAIAASSSLTFGTSLTFVYWVRFDAIAAWDTQIATGNIHQEAIWLAVSATNNMRFEINNTDHDFDPGFSLGPWFHVAAVYDGVNAKVYIDTVEKLSTAKTGAIANEIGMVIGNEGTADFSMDGQIDNVLAYNRALSAKEVESLYTDPFQMFQQEPIEIWTAATSVAGGAADIAAAGQADSISSTTAGFRRQRVAAGQADGVSTSLAGFRRLNRPGAGQADSISSTGAGVLGNVFLGGQADSVSSSLAGFRRLNIPGAGEADGLSTSLAGFIRLNRPGCAQADSVSQSYAGMTGGSVAGTAEELFRNRRFRLSSTYARRSFKGVF